MSHSLSPGFKSGDYWAVCDRCGFDFRVSKLREEWTGAVVCTTCWEPRHPQDFVKSVEDNQTPESYIRVPQEEEFVSVTYDVDATGNPEAQVPTGTFNNEL